MAYLLFLAIALGSLTQGEEAGEGSAQEQIVGTAKGHVGSF